MRVFLVGFPGAGKSTAGALAASALGRRFVDLDELIAAEAGRSTAALVAADLADFREREAAALARAIAAGGDDVIATGGGAAGWGDNLARMRAAGLVVALAVDLDVALGRVAASGPRPLLDRPRDEQAALHAAREVVYRRAHAAIPTDDRSPAEVAAAIVRLVHGAEALGRPTPWVVLADRSYPILVDDRPFADGLAGAVGPGRTALVTDANLAPWLEPVRAALVACGVGSVHLVQVPPGEASKSLATYGVLCERLVGAGLDRSSTIVALGGGVVGDLAGFVAATLFRGIDVVHLPTTLVAMTDSAIGGKTAIDLLAGKNLVGAFWQPRRVIAHLPTLATLPPRERRAGFGELWKYALLDGEDLWRQVAAHAAWAATTAPPPPSLAAVVERAATLKAAIVSRDERERRGERALLNLGHTLGHALETDAGGALLHGEAVGLGLLAAARVSCRLGLAGADLEPRVQGALAATGLPVDLDARLTPAAVARVAVDKKRKGDALGFIACAAPGACRVVHVRPDTLADLLRP
jgi:shikimate kinase/3-dehydroquinate synthase